MADKKLEQYAAKAQAAFEQNKTKREAENRLPSSSVSETKQKTGMERLVQGVSDFFGIKQPEPPKQKSILQRLMEVPVQQKSWYSGPTPTVSEAYAQIYKIGQKDQAAASQLFTQLQAFQQDPNTPFYTPYTQPTNRKIAEIASYGVDVSNGINDDFFKNYSWLMNHYPYGSTNNPLGTAKKRSNEQNAAAIYYDLLQDEDRTKKAENEWAALQEEVKYWAGRTDRNLSDAEILNRIDWSKYKTLQEMDESAANGAPIALNRAVGYSRDNLYGVLWEARNGVTGGDASMDAVRYRLGQGKSWKANSDIESRLDPASSRYNPYWTGNTMDKESLYFGVQEFGKNWLEDNKWMRGSNDATEQKMYQQVYSAEEFTQKAEAELESLNKVISDRMKKYGYDADKVLNGLIDDERYPSLTRLDESLKTGKLVDTTRAIRYSAADVERMVRDKCAAELNKLTSNAFAKEVYEKYGVNPPGPASVVHNHEDAVTSKINEQKSKNISDAKPTIAEKGTRGEQVVFTTASSPTYNDDVVSIADTASHGTTDPAAAVAAETQSANEYAGQNYIGAKTTLDNYDRLEKGLEQIEARIAELFGSAETEEEPKAKGAVDMSRVVGTAAGNPQERSLKAPSSEQSTKVTKDEQVAKERWISDQLKAIGDNDMNRQMLGDAWNAIPQAERDKYISAAAEERAKVSALDEKDREELYHLQQAADNLRAQLKDMEGAKAEAEQTIADVYDNYGISADLSDLTGAEAEGTIIQYLDILAPVLEEDIPFELSALSIYDQMEQDGYTFDQALDMAAKSKEEMQECLDLLTDAREQTKDYVELTDEQDRRYEQEKNHLEQSIRAADYYLLRGQDDFAATAQKGLDDFRSEGKPGFFESWSQYNLDMAIADPSTLQERSVNEQRRYDLVNHMTDAERQTYFYIRETQGTEAAKDYFNYLTDDTYGCITRRIYDTATAEAQGMADASPVLANLYSIVTSPTRALGGMYGFYQAMRGEAVNPYSSAMVNNAISSQIKQTTHEKIDSALGADTWGAKAAGFFYDALSSAAESGVNAIISPHLSLGTATSFFGKLGLKVAESVVGASVMGLGAAGDEMRRVVMDGGTVEQALSMGAVTFLSETLSEGISIGNITESFNRALEFGGPQAVQVLLDLVKSGVEEGSEEILGGLFSNWQEDRIMGELSERSQLAQQFKQEYIKDHEGVYDEAEADKYAQEMADKQIWKNLLKEGLSGFVSGVIGPAAATVTGAVENKVGGFVQERQQQRAQRKADRIIADNLAALNADTQAKTQSAQQAEAALEQARAERATLTEEQRADAEEKAAGLAEQADTEADVEYTARVARLEQEAEQARAEAERAAKQEQALRDFADSQEQSRNDAKAANEAAQKAKEAEEAARKARERADKKAEDYRVQQENEQKADQAEREAEQMRQEAERMAGEAQRSRERAEAKYDEYAQMYEAENAEIAEAPAAEGPAEAPEEQPAEQPAEAPERNADSQRVTNDVTILSQAASGDQSAQTAAVAGVLAPDGTNTMEASYAAQQLMMDYDGGKVAETLKKVFLTGVQRAGASLQDVKQAIVTAAENAQGRAHAILDAMLNGRVSAQQITELVAAAQQENADPAMREQARRQIKENRVDQRTKELIGNGAAEALKASEEKVDKAKAAVENAKSLLQDAKDKYGEITQRIRSLTEQLVNEPQNDTVKKLRTDALAEAKGQVSSIENMERAVDNAQDALAEAQERNGALQDKVLQPIREQAIAEIEAEDAAIAQAAAEQLAEMEQAAAEAQQAPETDEAPAAPAAPKAAQTADEGNDRRQFAYAAEGTEQAETAPAPKTAPPKRSPAQVAVNLAESVGVGHSIGTQKDMPRKALGFYEHYAKFLSVRSREAGNFMTTMHEIWHHLGNRLGMTGTKEMIANMNPGLRDQYSSEKQPGEAFAEFGWNYVIGDRQARDFAGDAFVDEFERKAKEGGYYKAIQQARSDIQAWLGASLPEKLGAVIRDKNTKPKGKNSIRHIIVTMADETSAAEAANKKIREQTGQRHVEFGVNIRNQALTRNFSERIAMGQLTNALTDSNGTRIGDGFSERMEQAGLKGEDFNSFCEYWVVKHSLDRDKQNAPVFDEKSFPRKAREAYVKQTETEHPEFLEAEKALQQFRTEFLQSWLVDTGFLTQEAFDEMNRKYPNYAPTFRFMDQPGFGRSTGGKTFTIRKATGGTQDIINPMDSFVDMVKSVVTMVKNNQVGLAFDNAYRQYEGMGEFGKEVSSDKRIVSIKMENVQEKVKEILGDQLDGDVLDRVLKAIGDRQTRIYDAERVNLPNVIEVTRSDGSHAYYQIFDTDLYNLIAGLNNNAASPVLQQLGKLNRFMSAMTTGSNPIFAVRNFMRDFQNSVNYGSWSSNYLTGAAKWIRSAYDVWTNKGEYADYVALGGGGWNRINTGTKQGADSYRNEVFSGYDKSTAGRTAKAVLDKVSKLVTLDRINEVIEQTSRYAEYKYGKNDKTTAEGRQEAFLASQDVTVDFARRGNSRLAADLKAIIPFFGASVQGVYRTSRMLTEAERGRAPARFAKTVINTALVSALCTALIQKWGTPDEKKEYEDLLRMEEYENLLSDDLKSNHFYIPNFAKSVFGDQPFLRIPVAQDPLTYFVHGAVTNALWYDKGDDLTDLTVSVGAMANTILDNLNPVSSTVLDPIIAMKTNKNWYGGSIVPTRYQDLPASDQYSDDTPGLFVTMGRIAGASPMKLQYLAEQYTGYLGQVLIPAFSKDEHTGELGGWRASIAAARKRLTSDPLISNDVVSSFYDGANAIQDVVDVVKAGRPLNELRRGLTEEEAQQAYTEAKEMTTKGGVVYDTKKAISGYYSRIDEINAMQGLSDTEKYALTSDVRREMISETLDAQEAIGAWFDRYVTGGNPLMKAIFEGAYTTPPTAYDTMPDTFKADASKPYMKRANEVYEKTEKDSALPHPYTPDQTFKSGGKEYLLSDGNYEAYLKKYAEVYELTVNDIPDWDTLTDEERLEKLTAAHTKAHNAGKAEFLK